MIKWGRDSITIEVDQRHVWDDAGDGDDKNRVQMTNDERDERDDTNDSQALTVGDITKHRALVARINYLSQDRPDLKFAAAQVRWHVGKPRAECLFHWQQSGELGPGLGRRQSHSTVDVSWSEEADIV